MTQVVTVSPATAAYVAQGLKTTVRPGAASLFEQRIEAWSEDAKVRGDAKTKALITVIQPPALALALITSGRPQPELTLAEVQRRYDENTVPPPIQDDTPDTA
jgi:hypothetical protein